MVRACRLAQVSEAEDTIGELSARYGRFRGRGDPRRRSEAPSRKRGRKLHRRTNRSLHAMRDITLGEAFGPDDIAILRTEKLLRPGLRTRISPVLIGRKAGSDLSSGDGLEWEDVGGFERDLDA